MPRIDPARLLGDLGRLRAFGAHGTGVVRESLSPIDVESRHWLVERMTEAGLEAGIDGVGTVLGRSRAPGPALLVGSHTDTQPTGGWLDGALGVVFGLEVARALAADPATAHLPVDVASWIDEEGRFSGCLGSRSFCGEVDHTDLGHVVAADGVRLHDAIAAAELDWRSPFHVETGRYLGYLEAHIEQGPYLEDEGMKLGVVTGIVGSRNYHVRFEGEQNHAGTTPMARRRDAARALFALAHRVSEEFPGHAGPRTVWTIGKVEVEPNAPSIVPGRAFMNLQFRDPDEARLDALHEVALGLIRDADAAERHAPGRWVRMPSAAVHDAQVLARHMPAGMLFVPSIRGISHSFEEDTAEDDIVLGCQVLADAAASALAQAHENHREGRA